MLFRISASGFRVPNPMENDLHGALVLGEGIFKHISVMEIFVLFFFFQMQIIF